MQSELHSRVDGPFVAVGFVAPEPRRAAAFAVAVEVARSRGQRRFAVRGSEALARAPLVHWSWPRAEPLLVFCRRGENPEALLPGQQPEVDAAAEAAATEADLQQFLADLRESPPTAEEVNRAATALRQQLQLPAAGESPAWATEPATLPGRWMAWVLASHHGIDVSALAAVDAKAVGAAVDVWLSPARGSWHALLPEPRSDHGFRRR